MEPMIELDEGYSIQWSQRLELEEGYSRDGDNDRAGGGLFHTMELMVQLDEGYSIQWSRRLELEDVCSRDGSKLGKEGPMTIFTVLNKLQYLKDQ